MERPKKEDYYSDSVIQDGSEFEHMLFIADLTTYIDHLEQPKEQQQSSEGECDCPDGWYCGICQPCKEINN